MINNLLRQMAVSIIKLSFISYYNHNHDAKKVDDDKIFIFIIIICLLSLSNLL